MSVRTAASAQLGFSAAGTGTYTTIAKVRDITLDINRDALETTGIGETDRTYAYGIRGTSGSGTLLYDSADTGTTAIINQILAETEALSTIQLTLDTNSAAGTITGSVLITATGASVSVGDLITVPISFTMSGKPVGNF